MTRGIIAKSGIFAAAVGYGITCSDASDGSVYVRDGNGKLTGAKKTSPFTPAEAAALVKNGNNNTVTLTFK